MKLALNMKFKIRKITGRDWELRISFNIGRGVSKTGKLRKIIGERRTIENNVADIIIGFIGVKGAEGVMN